MQQKCFTCKQCLYILLPQRLSSCNYSQLIRLQKKQEMAYSKTLLTSTNNFFTISTRTKMNNYIFPCQWPIHIYITGNIILYMSVDSFSTNISCWHHFSIYRNCYLIMKLGGYAITVWNLFWHDKIIDQSEFELFHGWRVCLVSRITIRIKDRSRLLDNSRCGTDNGIVFWQLKDW